MAERFFDLKSLLVFSRFRFHILQVASVTLFEKLPLKEVFSEKDAVELSKIDAMQLNLFEL